MKREQNTQEEESWIVQFRNLYQSASQKFSDGTRGADRLFSDDDASLIESIGATRQEIYDFIEDWIEVGEPDPQTVRRVTALRRDYFLKEQGGIPSKKTLLMNDLPSMGASLGGYRWLPRIIAKAGAKLRGEMPQELMYGCGGDRPFLRKLGISLEDFLRVVWEVKENEQHILDYVKQQSSGTTPS